MRDILFRGIRKDDNKWVYGHYVFILDTHYIYHYEPSELRYVLSEVIDETVGQFTGLSDKNGKKIFEDDIMNNVGNVVEFCNGSFCINGDSDLSLWTKTEVIGNIYDVQN